MKAELQPAYILHARPFRDSSLIVDCFTPDYGRLSLLAKGARSQKSRQRHLLQPFMPLLLSWQGKSDLKILVGAESRPPSLDLSGQYLFCGFYLNELMVRLLPELDAHPETYQRYEWALSQLAAGVEQEPLLRRFELGLLDDLGYGVDLSRDAGSGRPLQAQAIYHWVPEMGLTLQVPHLLVGPQSFYGANLLALCNEDFSEPATRHAAKRLTRLLLKPHLGARPLQSRKLFAVQPVAARTKEHT